MFISKTSSSDSNQVIGFNVLIRGGSSYESVQNNGISHMLEHLIVKKLQQVGGWVRPYYVDLITGYTYKDRIEFEGRMLTSDKDNLVRIIKDIFSNIEFSQSEFEIEKQVLIEELTEDEESEDYQYQRQENEWVYGNSSVALPTGGTVATIKKLTLQDIRDWQLKLFCEENCFVSTVGNVDIQDHRNISLELDKSKPSKPIQSKFVHRKPGEILMINDGKEQVSFSESWYSKSMDYKKTIQSEFFAHFLQDYFYYLLREKGLCYRFAVTHILHSGMVELTFTSWSDSSKLKAIQGYISDFLQSEGRVKENALTLYKESFVGAKQLESTDEQLQAHYHNWYKAFCGEEYGLDALIGIVRDIGTVDIKHLIELFGMNKQGVRVLQGKIIN